MNNKSPLRSSDLPDHSQRPPKIKHDSESPLISIDFRAPKIKKEAPKWTINHPDHRQRPKNRRTMSPTVVSINFQTRTFLTKIPAKPCNDVFFAILLGFWPSLRGRAEVSKTVEAKCECFVPGLVLLIVVGRSSRLCFQPHAVDPPRSPIDPYRSFAYLVSETTPRICDSAQPF